jgi:hypothetical protein
VLKDSIIAQPVCALRTTVAINPIVLVLLYSSTSGVKRRTGAGCRYARFLWRDPLLLCRPAVRLKAVFT